MSQFYLTLFGAFQLTNRTQAVAPLRSDKARALLAYLAVESDQAHPRKHLIDLLWHGYEAASARASLRTTLYNLRTVLAPLALLESNRQIVCLHRNQAELWVDALTLAELRATLEPPDEAAIAAALALYQGEFLADLVEVDSPPFQAWRQARQAAYAAQIASLKSAEQRPVGTPVHHPSPPHNLPVALTSFVGRHQEITTVRAQLLTPDGRVVVLIGEGGIGKTRLALAVGEQLLGHFADGVWFVAFTGIEPGTAPADNIAAAIGTALALPFAGANSLAVQVQQHLAQRHLLLILDNFERFTAATDFLATLLAHAPALRLLITSQHQLRLAGAVDIRVTEFAVPPPPTPAELATTTASFTAAPWLAWESVRLFVERADHARPGFALTPQNLPAVVQICQLVGGLPLGIELAAALLEQQAPAAICAAVQANYAALQVDFQDLPLRQRSARAIFLTSWAQLSRLEAQTMAYCAVFRGRFTLQAAQAVGEATATTLDLLIHKSLLRAVDDGLYTMHELVRQFAAEQLTRDLGRAHAIQARHATYYLELLRTWTPQPGAERAFRERIQQELDNVRLAWGWALTHAQLTALRHATEGLSHFYRLVAFYAEGETVFDQSTAQVRAWLAAARAPAAALDDLLIRFLLQRCIFHNALARLEQCVVASTEVIERATRLGDAGLAVEGYRELSHAVWMQGDYQQQRLLLVQALELAHTHGLVRQQAQCLSGLGLNAQARHEYAAALAYLHEGLDLAKQCQDQSLEVMLLNNLGTVYRDTGDFGEAARCFHQNLALMRATGVGSQIALATANLGSLWFLLGDYDQAQTCLEEALAFFAAQGAKRVEAEILTLLALLFEQRDELPAAARYCQQTIALAAPNSYYHPHREVLITLGHVCLRQGDIIGAHAAYTQANTLSQNARVAAEVVQGNACLAMVRLAQQQPTAALALVEEVLTSFAQTQFDPFQSPQWILLACYQVLVANNDPRAAAILTQAWTLVQQQAAKISDPVLCQSFLLNVPVNRELLRLGAAQQAPSGQILPASVTVVAP